MAPIRIYCNYRVVEGPWGGANSFLRRLLTSIRKAPGFELVDTPAGRPDLVLLNQLYRGPARGRWTRKFRSPRELRDWKAFGRPGLLARFSGGRSAPPKFVCRLVNLEEHAYGRRSAGDARLLAALKYTDADVFQSHYLREIFRSAGYTKPGAVIIHNGADTDVFRPGDHPVWTPRRALRLVSCTFATRASKRFDLIAAISRLPGVEVSHIGQWPAGQPTGNVVPLGALTQSEMAAVYRDRADAFLHPAERDICPNAVLEAMCAGLPVAFHPLGGTAELVGSGGVVLDERDVASGIEDLRQRYAECRAAVLASRQSLSIDRAADQYLALFRRTLDLA